MHLDAATWFPCVVCIMVGDKLFRQS